MSKKLFILVSFVLLLNLLGTASANLLAHYKLDGDFTDSAGTNNGTQMGAPVFVQPGMIGTDALRSAGWTDGFHCGTFDPTAGGNQFTFAAWVNWAGDYSGGVNTHTLVSKRDGWASGSMMFDIQWNPSGQNLEILNTGSWVNFGATLPVGTPTHLAVAYDGTNVTLYLNAMPILTYAFTLDSGRGSNLCVGQVQNGAGYFFNGDIDDVGFFSTALNQGQIATIMTGIPEPATMLLLGIGGLSLLRKKHT
jgi:hypothetical protein